MNIEEKILEIEKRLENGRIFIFHPNCGNSVMKALEICGISQFKIEQSRFNSELHNLFIDVDSGTFTKFYSVFEELIFERN